MSSRMDTHPFEESAEAPAAASGSRGGLRSSPLGGLSWWLLVVLLVVDGLFLVASLGDSSALRRVLPFVGAVFSGEAWNLGVDGSWPERWGFLKEAAIAALLIGVAARGAGRVLLAWAAVYLVVLLDDSLSLHETLGSWIVRSAALPADLGPVRGQDVAELIAWGGLGLVPLVWVVIAHRRSDPVARRRSRVLAVLFAALVGCALVLDAVHSAARASGPLDSWLGLLEDGGELVVLSLSLAWAVGVVREVRSARVAGPLGRSGGRSRLH